MTPLLVFRSKTVHILFSSVQSLSRVQLFVTPWTAAGHAPCPSPTPGIYPNSFLLSQWCHPTISSSVSPFSSHLQSFPASGSWVLCIRWPKFWSFIFSISPSKEDSGLMSFRMDWLDLLAVKGTLKSLLQHHSSKALILQCSAFFIIQFSHLYMTAGKTIPLTRRTFVGKVLSLLFHVSAKLVFYNFPSKV